MSDPTNTLETGKTRRDARGRWVKGTPPPNPKGRPADGESYSGLYKLYGEMTPAQIAELVGGEKSDLGRMLLQVKASNVPLKHIVVLRAMLTAANDPQPGILKEIADRAEGKVPDRNEVKAEITIDGFEKILKAVYGGNRDE
jgi:hypothetical protein